MNGKQNLSHDWFIHVNDEDKRLYVSREKPNPSGAFSPCNMSPDDVDYEMSKGKSKKVLEKEWDTGTNLKELLRAPARAI